MEGVGERATRASEFIESLLMDIYGAPSEKATAVMKQATASGVDLIVRPHGVGGYIRLEES